MKKAVDFIKSSNNILILTHRNPDGDAVGSVLGLADALSAIGKDVACFSKDIIPDVFEFLPNTENIKNKINPTKYDLIILLDCASISRTGLDNIGEVATSFEKMLIIDHHPREEKEYNHNGDYMYVDFIDCQASSTAVLIYDILKQMNIEITKNIANCLLTGIFTDTGGFQHNNTDQKSLEAAAEFMKKGSRVEKISKNIFSNKNISAIKLWGKAISRIKTDEKTGMAVSYISKEDMKEYNAREEDLSGLIGIINTVSDAKFSLLLTEYEDKKIRGSLRSEEYKGIDVSSIARILGGGGHKLASGFEIDGSIENSVLKISNMINEMKSNK